jgi:hypothetical protein
MIDQLFTLLKKYDSESNDYLDLFEEIHIGAKTKLMEEGDLFKSIGSKR